MKKCYYCPWHSDKCKNPNSRNKDKFLEDIKHCKPMLINKDIKPKLVLSFRGEQNEI